VRLAGLVAALALALPGVALASDATSAQVRALAGRASQDPGALAELRRIDRVDGVRVDLGRALRGRPGRSLDARLRVLAGSAGAPGSAGSARDEARSILAQRRYRGSSVPRPLHGVLQWLGRKFSFVGRGFNWLGDRIPGGNRALWTILAALLVGGAVAIVSRLVRRRAAEQLAGVEARRADRGIDPSELERLAVEAERTGDLATAIRLRFRAGLLRLARARAIPPRDSITTREVRRTLRLPEFDALAVDFDEIVYGGRDPREGDVEAARRGWPLVLAKAGSR
jgi:hypothetical protein